MVEVPQVHFLNNSRAISCTKSQNFNGQVVHTLAAGTTRPAHDVNVTPAFIFGVQRTDNGGKRKGSIPCIVMKVTLK